MTSNDRLQQTVAFREQLLHGLDYASTSRRKDARFLASLFQELASLFQLSTYVFAPATHGRLTNFFETSIQDKQLTHRIGYSADAGKENGYVENVFSLVRWRIEAVSTIQLVIVLSHRDRAIREVSFSKWYGEAEPRLSEEISGGTSCIAVRTTDNGVRGLQPIVLTFELVADLDRFSLW